jgi:hypothetical protein
MNTTLIRAATLACASTATLLLSGCETTGDPSTGGIFWSERKAQGRLAERQSKLEHVERQTGQDRLAAISVPPLAADCAVLRIRRPAGGHALHLFLQSAFGMVLAG